MKYTASTLIAYLSDLPKCEENQTNVSSLNLPENIQWVDFIANLSALQHKGLLTYKVSREIDFLVATVELLNDYSAPSRNDSSDWHPARQTISTLACYGIDKAKLTENLQNYLSSQPDKHSNSDFIKFCIDKSADVISLLLVPESWKPSESTVANLYSAGMDSGVLNEYLEVFVASKYSLTASWDAEFESLCMKRWRFDNRNPNATETSRMSRSWEPNIKTINALIAEDGLTQRQLEGIAAEYRLYWIERGEARANWDGHFKWWVKSTLKSTT